MSSSISEFHSSSDASASLLETVQCIVCYEIFDELDHTPRVLPCGHTSCQSCIDSMIANSSKPLSRDANSLIFFPCPECRARCTVTERGFPINYPVQRFVACLGELKKNQAQYAADKASKQPQDDEKAEADTEAQAEVEAAPRDCCEECPEFEADPAVSICLECNWKLCELHSNAHKKSRSTASHSLRSIQDLSSQEKNRLQLSQPIKCHSHPSQLCNYYCVSCEQLVCVECGLVTHSGHEMQEGIQALQAFKTQLKSIRQTVQDEIQAYRDSVRRVMPDDLAQQFEARYRKGDQEWSETFRRLREILDRRDRDIRSGREAEWKAAMKEIEWASELISIEESRGTGVLHFIDRITQGGYEPRILRSKQQLLKEFNDPKHRQFSVPSGAQSFVARLQKLSIPSSDDIIRIARRLEELGTSDSLSAEENPLIPVNGSQCRHSHYFSFRYPNSDEFPIVSAMKYNSYGNAAGGCTNYTFISNYGSISRIGHSHSPYQNPQPSGSVDVQYQGKQKLSNRFVWFLIQWLQPGMIELRDGDNRKLFELIQKYSRDME